MAFFGGDFFGGGFFSESSEAQPSGPIGGGYLRHPVPSSQEIRDYWLGKINPQAAAIIEEVALRQVDTHDEHRRFEELLRELEAQEIEWDARYLTALNEIREVLIREEIKTLLKKKDDEEALLIIMLAAHI